MKLSPHFSLDEATISQTATRLGIDNTPSPDVIKNMVVAADGMELVRDLLSVPIHVNSWFRCLRLNRSIGSKDTSAHIQGFAVDFIAPKYGTPKEICKAIIDSDINYDQIIQEGNWVHISFSPKMRKIALTATFNNSIVTYTEGV